MLFFLIRPSPDNHFFNLFNLQSLMRNFIFLFTTIYLIIALPNVSIAQEEVMQVQPMIMVVPHVKENEDLRTVMDENIDLRVAISKVKEAFDSRGYTTVDFYAKIKAQNLDETYTSSDPSGLKAAIASASGADIYVEVEAYKSTSPQGNSARIILSAYDAFTGQSLANKTNSSMMMYTDMFDKLVEQALKRKTGDTDLDLMAEFLNVMQDKFTDIVKNGRTIKMIFSLNANAAYDFDTETDDGELLSDMIEDWVADNAFKNNYANPRMMDDRLYFEEVRIPLRDDNGRNYSPSKFARKARSSFRKWIVEGEEIKINRDVRGGTIYLSFE